MMPFRIKKGKGSRQGRMIQGIFLLMVMVILLVFPLVANFVSLSPNPLAEEVLQEKIGYRISVLSRWDRDRKIFLGQQIAALNQGSKQFETERPSGRQEVLGLGIARAGERIFIE